MHARTDRRQPTLLQLPGERRIRPPVAERDDLVEWVRPRRPPGFDLTFRAPKSVSLLWALGDDDVAGQVVAGQVKEAHDDAVTATLSYLEQHVARSRRGAGGTEQVAVDGLVAAGFTHRTSRADDPLLHTHLLVANLARTSDDRDHARLTIRQTVTVADGIIVWQDDAKSHDSERTIALDTRTVTTLRAHRTRQTAERLAAGPAWFTHHRDRDLVFTRPDGTAFGTPGPPSPYARACP